MKLRFEDKNQRPADRLDFDVVQPTRFGAAASFVGVRNLMIIIITMPVVFLVVVLAIIGFFGGAKDSGGSADAGAVRSTPAAALEQPATAGRRAVLPIPAATGAETPSIAMPAGGEAGAIALDGNRLAIRVDAEDGSSIVIYDLNTDAVVKTIALTKVE